ncbi:MAG: hypothetical protein EP330_07040 [Deltaproteobacteria bacterium]|nr:MAG: hypothetical protein EP330_07040 [Deltaproteobacteria bacterium]
MKRFLPLLAGFAALGAILVFALTRPPAPEPAPRLSHFAEFDRLVRAAWTGDRPLAGLVATDLTAGPEADANSDAVATVGGALGFIGFAEDAEELADAVSRAAAGCGECHTSLGIPAPPRPAWSHETSGAWLAHGLVWGEPASPPGGAAPIEVTAGWDAPLPKDSADLDEHALRVARAWTSCVACHAHETELPAR